MSAELVQDAIINKLSTDPTVAAEFGADIKKGIGRTFNFNAGSKAIRVYLTLENFTRTTLPHKKQEAVYPFIIIILFYEPDEETCETRKTQYSKMVRAALEKDITLNGTCYDARLGDTRYYFHPDINAAYYLAVPLAVKKKETVG